MEPAKEFGVRQVQRHGRRRLERRVYGEPRGRKVERDDAGGPPVRSPSEDSKTRSATTTNTGTLPTIPISVATESATQTTIPIIRSSSPILAIITKASSTPTTTEAILSVPASPTRTATVESSTLMSSPTSITETQPITTSPPSAPSSKSRGPTLVTLTGIAVGIFIAVMLFFLILFGRNYLRKRVHINRAPNRYQEPRQSIWGADMDTPSTNASPRNSMLNYIPPMIQRTPSSQFPSNDGSLVSSIIPPTATVNQVANDGVFSRPELYSTSPVAVPKPLKTKSGEYFPTPNLERRPSTGGVMNSRIYIRPARTSEIGVAKGSGIWVPQVPQLPPKCDSIKPPPPPKEVERALSVGTASPTLNEYDILPLPPTYPYNKGINATPEFPFEHPPASASTLNEKSAFDIDTTEYASTLDWDVNLTPNSNRPSGLTSPPVIKPSDSASQVGLATPTSIPGQLDGGEGGFHNTMGCLERIMVLADEDDIHNTPPKWKDPLTWAQDQARRNGERMLDVEGEKF